MPEQREGGGKEVKFKKKKKKRPLILPGLASIRWLGQHQGGVVLILISSFQQPFPGGQAQIVSLRVEQRLFSLTFRQGGRVP